jgi:Flp pilus assembly protein TadD
MAQWQLAAGLLLAIALLSGCAAQREVTLDVPPLVSQPHVPLGDTDILALSPAMLAFLDNALGADVPRSQRTTRLARAILEPGALGFSYDALRTLSAADAFDQRRGNCLAFSNLFIAMARQLGLDAWYQEVPLPPQWSDIDGVWLVNLHVNVVIPATNGHWVVDVSGQEMTDNQRARRLTDAEALALYLTTSAPALLARDLPLAHAYLHKAIGVAPRLPHVWSNLGVAYDRNGQTGDAIRAYELALQLDPVESRSANNLFEIFKREGNLSAAEKLQSRVEKRRRRNPYYQYQLARQALAEQRYEDADRLLRRAIALNNRDYRFHYDLARLRALMGETAAARKSLERARNLAPANVQLAAANPGGLMSSSD